MQKVKLIYLKNQMLVANTFANLIGVLVVTTLMESIQEATAKGILETPVSHWIVVLFDPFAFFFVINQAFHGTPGGQGCRYQKYG